VDLSANLHITPKGVDEVKLRVHNLGMKKRSVLILLDTPKSLAQILEKSVFPKHEVLEEVDILIGAGFISASGGDAPHSTAPRALEPAAGGVIELNDEIILSEAKFLLTDFAVDSFGAHSQPVVDEIRSCQSIADFRSCLNAVAAAVGKRCPAQLPTLYQVIGQINETA